jgi:hypothetical protein
LGEHFVAAGIHRRGGLLGQMCGGRYVETNRRNGAFVGNNNTATVRCGRPHGHRWGWTQLTWPPRPAMISRCSSVTSDAHVPEVTPRKVATTALRRLTRRR